MYVGALNLFDARQAERDTWEVFVGAEAFVEGNFILASGPEATLKVDAEKVFEHPRLMLNVMGHFALHPSMQEADVLLYVPDGMRKFMSILGLVIDKPVAHTQRKLGATSRYEFEFCSKEDEELARSARRPLIGEDVVTSLGSVAGVRRLLHPEQDVHSLALLLRGHVNPEYQKGLTDHYLLVRDIPTDKDEFRSRMANGYYEI